MKFGRILWAAVAAGLFLAGASSASAAPKPVLVHYMPWFVGKPFSGSWGWHWTMNHYSPDSIDGAGKRQIASWFYPSIGPYDSADPVVLEYHVLLMKLSGVDGVIVDWYGQDNYADYAINNQRTAALFNFTRKAGLAFALCYEDATIQNEINGGYVTAGTAIAHAQQTLLYAQTNYFNAPGYLRRGAQPVFLNFGPQYFRNNSQWVSIFSVLSSSNQPSFFTEDNKLPVGAGAFDWPPMWLSQTNGGVLATNALESYLANFQQAGNSWPAYISSAFPRFQDIYAQAGAGSSHGTLADNGGDTLRATLGRAMTNTSAMIQITTWNDFGEGTMVEPTQEFGYRDLGILQDFRRQYLDPTFAYDTNDLGLATRQFNLRRQFAANAVVSAELDRVFTNIIGGNLQTANQQIAGVESGHPVIANLSANGGSLQFSVNGYLSNAGFQIQTSTNLSLAGWQTVANYPGSTNQVGFSTPIPTGPVPVFFRVRNLGP